MAIQDDSSVALIPSAYGTSKVYSVIPSNGNGDFTFSRSGNATRVNKGGFIETMGTNVPRLDYPLIDGLVQDCPALLLEPTSTNYTTRSEEFDNSAWTKSATTVIANQEIAPDGNLTADKILETTASSTHVVYNFVTGTSGNNTFSVFVKPINRKKIRLAQNLTLDSRADFDIDTLSISNETRATGKIEKFPNGWFRLSISFSATFTSMLFAFYILDDNGNDSYTGNTSNGFYLWGAMNEYLAYPTSYIKTTSGQVTRSADVCNGSGTSAEFNSQSGALFAEFKTVPSGGNFLISVADGTSNTGAVFVGADANEKIYSYYNSANHTSDIDSFKHFNKIVNTWDSSGVKIYINGFSRTVSGSQSLSSSDYDNLRFSRANGSLPFYGDVKQVMTFKTALNDSELETLTSWDSFNAMATGQLYTIE
jgi:hypothetical protein